MTKDSTIELQLLRWNEGPTGRTVTFLLPSDTPSHPFKNLRTGPANGQRLGAAFVLIADDETTHEMPVQAPEKPADGPNGKGRSPRAWDELSLAQQAGIACSDPRFWRFILEKYGCHAQDSDTAAEIVRLACDVKSRAEFDTDPVAAKKWRDMHGQFFAWRET